MKPPKKTKVEETPMILEQIIRELEEENDEEIEDYDSDFEYETYKDDELRERNGW